MARKTKVKKRTMGPSSEPICPICCEQIEFDEYVDAIDFHDSDSTGYECPACSAKFSIASTVVRTFVTTETSRRG